MVKGNFINIVVMWVKVFQTQIQINEYNINILRQAFENKQES